MVTLLFKEQNGSTGERRYIPVDDYTKIYMKREIGVDILTADELDLLQMLVSTPGFNKFKIEVQEKDIINDVKQLEEGDYL
jgi:hypothetical protein